MDFRQTSQYARELTGIIDYYVSIDREIAECIFNRLLEMEAHLGSFPEAAPLTSEPPIRKFILSGFPLRIRYVHEQSKILLLTIEHMKQNRPL